MGPFFILETILRGLDSWYHLLLTLDSENAWYLQQFFLNECEGQGDMYWATGQVYWHHHNSTFHLPKALGHRNKVNIKEEVYIS